MEVRAPCIRLSVKLFLLLGLQMQNICKAYKPAMSHVDPSRLQFFEYETISISCETLDFSPEWTLKWNRKEDATKTTEGETSGGSITIYPAYASHTGEYWCENEAGERSNSVNISVTAGQVILESPSVPLTEGDSVNLNCRKRKSDINLSADFYKNGNLTETGYEGTLTIDRVSKSDEGFYKCSISGAGDSLESWLSVRETETKETSSPKTAPTDGSPHHSILLPVVLTVLFIVGLLLVVGLLHFYKVGCFSPETSAPGEDSASEEASATYAVVTKFPKNRAQGSSRRSADRTVTAHFKPSFGSEEVIYSSVKK